jgi:hypothetical protein
VVEGSVGDFEALPSILRHVVFKFAPAGLDSPYGRTTWVSEAVRRGKLAAFEERRKIPPGTSLPVNEQFRMAMKACRKLTCSGPEALRFTY